MFDHELELMFENGYVRAYGTDFVIDEIVYLSVRPENVKCAREPMEGFTMRGVVKEHIYIGSIIKTSIELPNGQLIRMSSLPDTLLQKEGDTVYVYWKKEKAVLIHTKEDRIYDLIDEA